MLLCIAIGNLTAVCASRLIIPQYPAPRIAYARCIYYPRCGGILNGKDLQTLNAESEPALWVGRTLEHYCIIQKA